MSDFILTENRIVEINELIERLSHYKAQRTALEEYRKILKANLMKEALGKGITAVQAQEREAYSSDEYQQVVEALKVATKEETQAYYQFKLFEIEIDVWRTRQASLRKELENLGG